MTARALGTWVLLHPAMTPRGSGGVVELPRYDRWSWVGRNGDTSLPKVEPLIVSMKLKNSSMRSGVCGSISGLSCHTAA
jgi:hypothetical protein